MAAQLNNAEKEIFERVIREELKKDEEVHSLRIVFYLRNYHNLRRHLPSFQWAFVRRMRKIIEEKTSCKHCQTVCAETKKNFTCKMFVRTHIEDK